MKPENMFEVNDMVIMNRYKVADAKKFKRFMFMSILLISLSVFTFTATSKAYSKDIAQYDLVSVQQGDTIWSIASSYAEEGNIRELIYNIYKINNIQKDRPIYPGDVIRIPLN
jgi:hypothetical protein